MKSSRQKSPPVAPPGPVTAAPRRRVLIVDDHPFMRAGVAQLIDRQPDLMVGGEAGNPAEAGPLLAKGGVDLLLTDMTMPGRSGLDFLKDLQAIHPNLPILVLSMHDEMVYAERALRAGARGYIMKEAGGENLLAAIRQVLGGQVYVSARMATVFLGSFSGSKTRDANSPFGKLTDREFEVFQLIGQGRSTREIAQQLGLSTKTVDVHRANLKAKLDLKDTTALVRHAVRWV
ncbi:MAG: Two component transcriptional regulator, LuxR family, partial [Lacunisphaera sp.]|nr:Two component transcriptional regulator, LuxR family [Lacunisphaera sp.]